MGTHTVRVSKPDKHWRAGLKQQMVHFLANVRLEDFVCASNGPHKLKILQESPFPITSNHY